MAPGEGEGQSRACISIRAFPAEGTVCGSGPSLAGPSCASAGWGIGPLPVPPEEPLYPAAGCRGTPELVGSPCVTVGFMGTARPAGTRGHEWAGCVPGRLFSIRFIKLVDPFPQGF